MTMLKAMTLHDPYASLMAIGAKRNETRGRSTGHRGELAIHTSLVSGEYPEDVFEAALRAFAQRDFDPRQIGAPGCIIAVVDLHDVKPTEAFAMGQQLLEADLTVLSEEERMFGNYSPGRFVYLTRGLRRLARPVPCRGYQSIGWMVPPEIEAEVRRQLQTSAP